MTKNVRTIVDLTPLAKSVLGPVVIVYGGFALLLFAAMVFQVVHYDLHLI